MIHITKPINTELLFEELETIGSVSINDEGERVTTCCLTKTNEGYVLSGEPLGADIIVLMHDHTKLSEKQLERIAKASRKYKVLKKLGLTDEELEDLL